MSIMLRTIPNSRNVETALGKKIEQMHWDMVEFLSAIDDEQELHFWRVAEGFWPVLFLGYSDGPFDEQSE